MRMLLRALALGVVKPPQFATLQPKHVKILLYPSVQTQIFLQPCYNKYGYIEPTVVGM